MLWRNHTPLNHLPYHRNPICKQLLALQLQPLGARRILHKLNERGGRSLDIPLAAFEIRLGLLARSMKFPKNLSYAEELVARRRLPNDKEKGLEVVR